MECLNDIIGIYSGECECIELPESSSGYNFYLLDDHDWSIPLNSLNASLLCGDNDLLSVSEKAMLQGKNKMIEEIKNQILSSYRSISKPFIGAVGQLGKADSYKTFTGVEQGFDIEGYRGTWQIYALGVYLQDAQTVNIQITDDRDTVFAPIEILAKAGKVTKVDVSLTLPLYDSMGKINYQFRYSYTGRAYNIKYSCGCSDDNYKQISSWMKIQGIDGTTNDQYTHGLIVSGSMECDSDKFICSLLQRKDSKIVIERLYQFYSIQSLGSYFLKSTNINALTALSKDSILAHMQELQKQIDWRIDWLFSKTELVSNCFVCNSPFSMERGELII